MRCVGAIVGLGLVLATVSYFYWLSVDQGVGAPVACTTDAKICPDGTTVARTGPMCEFGACPSVASSTLVLPPITLTAASSTDLELSVGQTVKTGSLFVTLNRFLEDNRCSISIECVHAGSVTVHVTFARGVHTETDNMRSDDAPRAFENYNIAIIGVAPVRKGGERIPAEDYRVTFRVEEITSQ